jgi:hypothetical protein
MISVFKLALELWDASLSLQKQWDKIIRPECKVLVVFYATLAYIRHFIFAGCYDNNPWYLVQI